MFEWLLRQSVYGSVSGGNLVGVVEVQYCPVVAIRTVEIERSGYLESAGQGDGGEVVHVQVSVETG